MRWHCILGAQARDQIDFLLTIEGEAIDLIDRHPVGRGLRSNCHRIRNIRQYHPGGRGHQYLPVNTTYFGASRRQPLDEILVAD